MAWQAAMFSGEYGPLNGKLLNAGTVGGGV
jgi:hypothetical protein